MDTPRRLAPAALLFALCLARAEKPIDTPRPRPGAELKRLRVLLVLDTDSDLGRSLRIDRDAVEALFAAHVPKGRYTLDVLDGKKVTRENVVRHYRNLETGPGEGLLFYFGGHGATDAKRGHYMQMRPGGPPLVRSDLRRAMEEKGAGLVVLLTDCCGSHVNLKPKKADMPEGEPVEKKPLHPTLRELLFLARGTVDITGCSPGASSWSDSLSGGVFTRACVEVLTDPVKSLDKDRDGRLTWKEVFPVLRSRTESTFRKWKAGLPRSAQGQVDDATQRPHAFLLREGGAAPDAAPVPKAKSKKDG